jgi:two-component system, chemotaxis family, protein-glutamate methylesterase/glutaminase
LATSNDRPDQTAGNGDERAPRCLVLFGASAGGIPALVRILEELPATLPAAVLLVLHLSSDGASMLPRVLARAGDMDARFAADGDRLGPGYVMVAPPDRHLLVVDGHVELSRGPRENGHRPAVDCLFRSAAHAYGPRVIGVILSGARSDGALGLAEIKRCGGMAIVQADPVYAGMPTSALEAVHADHVVPSAQLAALLCRVVPEVAGRARAAARSRSAIPEDEQLFQLPATGLTCPECGGALWQFQIEGAPVFACHVGHRFSADALDQQQAQSVERAVMAAVRALEERAALQRQLAARLDPLAHRISHERALRVAAEAERQADLIRRTLLATPVADAADIGDEVPNREVPRGGRT